MATLNLGNIKFNWKGAYAGGTAYVVDDVVSYSGSSYICKLASTGNLPTNGTYWDQMSSAGTNGTDLTTTLTTQGDVLYRDGSGLQKLAAGTSGQYLKTQGTGANPVWSDVTTSVLKVESFRSTTRQTGFSGSYSTVMNGNYTKVSASSKIVVFCTYAQFGESNGSGTNQFNLGTSSDLNINSYGNTANHSKNIPSQFYISNNTQTGSLAWTWRFKDFGGSVFNPSSSDDSRIDSGAGASTVTIMEYA